MVSKIVEYNILPVIATYTRSDLFKKITNSMNSVSKKKQLNNLNKGISEFYNNSKFKPYLKYIDKVDLRNYSKVFVDNFYSKNPKKLHKKYSQRKIEPLFLNSNNLSFFIKNNKENYIKFDYSGMALMACNQAKTKYQKKECYNNLLTIANKNNDNSLYAAIYFNLKEYKKSLYYYNKELKNIKNKYGKESLNVANIYKKIAFIQYKLQKYKKSFKYLKKSINIYAKYSSNSLVYCNSLKMIKLLNTKIKIDQNYINRYKKSFKKCKLNKKLSKKEIESIKASLNLMASLNMYESPCFDIGTIVPLQIYKDNIDASKIINGKNSFITAMLYNDYAKKLYENKKYKDAYINITKSFKSILFLQQIQFETMNLEQKKLFLEGVEKIKNNYLLIALNYYKKENNSLKAIQEIFTNWLRFKGSIFNSENSISTLYLVTKDKNLKDIIAKYYNKQRALASLLQSPIPLNQKIKRANWQKKIKELNKEIESLNSKIASKSKSYKELQELQKITYYDIAKYLKNSELYIDFAKTKDSYYIFTIDKSKNITFKMLTIKDAKKVDKLIKEYGSDVKYISKRLKELSKKDLNKLKSKDIDILSKLYTILIDKYLKNTIKDKNSLIISSDGALRLLPFEALYSKDKKRYLIEEKNIRYIPSGKEFVRLYKFNNKKSSNDIAVFYDPNYNLIPQEIIKKAKEDEKTKLILALNNKLLRSGVLAKEFDSLPNTKEEARVIKELYKDSVKEYNQDKATQENLFKINGVKILHLSTHGFYLDNKKIKNPMLKSGIVLAGANYSIKNHKDYGIIYAQKLLGLNLKGTDLVVLSACDTAKIDSSFTDSISGLNKAFLQAGAKNIVSTLWEVADKESAILVKNFYKKIKEHKSYSQALKEAKIKMIKRHPYFWSGFIIHGE